MDKISPLFSKIKNLKKSLLKIYISLSPERVIIFWVSFSVSFLFIFFALITFNTRFLVSVPAYGGSIHEGIIGTPRFINPILATTDQDKDLTALIFAGLTKRDAYGKIILDMAESITESEDHLKYNVTIKPNAKFHDGIAVTSDDVLYTVNQLQNPSIKSPSRIEWEGIGVERHGDKEITFMLKKPFPRFMETLTIGIVPKHIWKNLNEDQISLSDYNIHAIGSGPYVLKKITTNSGIPETFTLTAFKQYTLGRPYINSLTISTYQNEKYLLKAFSDGEIDRVYGIPPEKISSLHIATSTIHTSILPRTFAVFFNPNKNTALSDKNVRAALQMAIDKDAIVHEVLLNYGKVLNDPYPYDNEVSSVALYNPEQAKTLLHTTKSLKKASSTLEITLATANTDEMKKVAEMIKADWEKIGVTTKLSVYEVSDLNQNVIKDRDFQALLFGTITQNPSDLYAFWHSSQRTYPGLNISNYVSKKLDSNLEILRTSEDQEEQADAYQEVKQEFHDEVPGIFLFSPSLIYITNDKVISLLPNYSYDNASRFLLVESWYRFTNYVWPKTYYKPLLALLENIIH
jgi:peptide/nickel transport system substrate-binding protein